MKLPEQRLRIPQGVIEIDGSYGEGGGQIVRTACALSALTGLACRVRQIRAGRSTPGLRAQHCATLRGLARMCAAETSPLRVGAAEVVFTPGCVPAGDLEVDTGTAGSVALVLQGILLAAAGSPASALRVVLRGGTDVPGAPCCDYLRNIKQDVLHRMGYAIELKVIKRGYYPRGGGVVEAAIRPPAEGLLAPLHLPESTEAMAAHGISYASRDLASRHVAERQARTATRMLTEYLHVPARIEVDYRAAACTGSGLVVWARSREAVWGASALGRPGTTAEQVAEQATERLLRTYHSRAALDPWLGDQILPFLALAKGPSVVSVPALTRHMRTNIWVIRQFLSVEFSCESVDDRVLVHCRPDGT